MMGTFNIVCTLFLTGLVLFCIIRQLIGNDPKKIHVPSQNGIFLKIDAFAEKYEWVIFGLLLLIALFIRFWNFPQIPGGVNQDEASIAYDVYSISNFGIDRNGFPFPVYPIAWGAGHGPFYTYFSMLFVKLFGLNIFAYRLPQDLLALTSVVFFYFLIKRMRGTKTALIGLFILAICPWHVLLSRWALDANPLPAVFLIATYFLVSAMDSQKPSRYFIAAGIYGLSMYVYGAIFVVLPIFFVLTFLYLLYHKKIKLKTLLISGGIFIIVSLPMIIFMAINIFHLPEIITPYFSFSHFTVMRSSSTFRNFSDFIPQLQNSLKDYFSFVFLQKPDGLIWNSIKDFGIVYMFSLPLIIIGLILVFRSLKVKEYNKEFIFCAWFIAASVYTIRVNPNINRINIIFLPIVYFTVLGIDYIRKNAKYFLPIVLIIFLVAFGSFTNYYFTKYPTQIGQSFFESFGDAVQYAADKTDGTIYITENVNGNYILTLYYLKTDPHVFNSTVQYADPKAEFRMAKSFDRFVFNIPKNKSRDCVYVIPNNQINEFNQNLFNIQKFKYYSVAYGKQ